MRIGVDLGGTKTEAVLMAGDGSILLRKRIPTARHDYAQIIRDTAALVREMDTAAGTPCPVGVGTPGARSLATGRMKNSNTTCINDQLLWEDLCHALDREVRISNDANCFALSEAIDGAGEGAAVVFGVIIGTGVGGGLVVNGQLVEGANAIAGEWGHNLLPGQSPSRDCYCGRVDCVETWLCGAGLLRTYQYLGGNATNAIEIAAHADAVDQVAIDALDQYCQQLAMALASIINIVDPAVIVLGGGLSNISQLYEAVPRHWGRWVFSDEIRTRLVPARHGDSSGVRGAARLWPA